MNKLIFITLILALVVINNTNAASNSGSNSETKRVREDIVKEEYEKKLDEQEEKHQKTIEAAAEIEDSLRAEVKRLKENKNSMGEYVKFRDEFSNSQDPQQTHRMSMQSGFEKRDIYFTEKTPDNNIIMQPFEFTDKGMTKLSIIDGGEYIKASTRERRHVFHIGKLFADTKKTTTYVHIFTLVFREIN